MLSETTFAGKTILNGKQANSIDPLVQGGAAGADQSITLQVGSNKGDTIGFNLVDLQFSAAAIKAGIAQDQFVDAAAADKAFVKGCQWRDYEA